MSLQLPLGAPLHLSGVICMRPCSPAPPTACGLQLLSCIAIEANTIAGTNHRESESTGTPSGRRSMRTRTVMLLPVLNECGNDLITAGSKCGMSRALQRDDYKLFKFNWGRRPAAAIDATIQPVNMAIGSAQLRDLRCMQTTVVRISRRPTNALLNEHVAPTGLQWP